MALALDATSSGGTNTNQTIVSHICAANPTVLIVNAVYKNSSTPTATYNGVSLTALTSQFFNVGGQTTYWISNPAAGTHNIIVQSASADSIGVTAVSYTGFLGSLDGNNGNQGTSTGLTASITTVADNDWVVLCAGTNNTISASTGATQRVQGSQNGYVGGIYDNNGPKHPAGAISESLTFTSSAYGYTIVALKPTNPQTITDTITSTEKVRGGNKLTETIHLITVYTLTFSDVITSSDAYVNGKKLFQNILKSISSWTNQSKS